MYGANAVTRQAGGRLAAAAKPVPRRVVVDMREFMSSLPAVLHHQGFELVPVTLEVRGCLILTLAYFAFALLFDDQRWLATSDACFGCQI